MTPDDMAQLHARAFTVPRPWSCPEFVSLLQSPHVFAIGDKQGFILGRAIAGEAEVLTLAVAPECRRMGKARQLMAAYFAKAIERAAETAFLEVAEDNAAAIKLYETVGFSVAGRRRGYFSRTDGPALDAIVMTKPLAPGSISG